MKTLLSKHLNEGKIALVFFNKETKHVLELYNAGVKNGNYEIEFLIDFSLPFRPKVFEIAKALIPEERIITTVTQFASMIAAGRISFAVFFDAGFDCANEVGLFPYSKELVLIESDTRNAYKLGKHKADEFARGEDKTFEFNFRWPTDIVATVVEHVIKNGICAMQGYTNDRLPSLTSTYDVFKYQILDWDYVNPLAYASRYDSDIFEDLRNARLNFVLGTDYGVGKASYIIDRFLKDRQTIPLLSDYCYLLNFPYYQYPVGTSDALCFKERVISSIARAYYNDDSDPKKEIYYKFEGRLEDMIYGFPVDRALLWGNLHEFFKNYTFTIVAKPSENEVKLRSDVERLMTRLRVRRDQVDVVSMSYDGVATTMLVA